MSKMRTVCLRLTASEYEALSAQAGPNLSAYIRARLDFDADPITDLRTEVADHEQRLSTLEALAHAQGAYS